MSIAGLEILNLHAHGGMAEVYRARGTGADGRVWYYALKKILPELTQDTELRAMFAEEARVASLLVHPNIVRVYDLVVSDHGEYFIVMEFLDGRDLADAINAAAQQGRTLPLWFAVHCAREILKALAYGATDAKDKDGRVLGLVHRDVSPNNVLVSFDGQVKLTDFGVAKVQNSSIMTQAGMMKGKFGYMSPEQLAGIKIDPRSDLFNVGIMLYEALTGVQLFSGDTPQAMIRSMLDAHVPAFPSHVGVSPALDALVRRALQRERDARHPSAFAMEQELTAIARAEGLVRSYGDVVHEMHRLFPERAPPPPPSPSQPKKLASVVAPVPQPMSAETLQLTPLPQEPEPRVSGARPLPSADGDPPTILDVHLSERTNEEALTLPPETTPSTGPHATARPRSSDAAGDQPGVRLATDPKRVVPLGNASDDDGAATIVSSGQKVVPLKPKP